MKTVFRFHEFTAMHRQYKKNEAQSSYFTEVEETDNKKDAIESRPRVSEFDYKFSRVTVYIRAK